MQTILIRVLPLQFFLKWIKVLTVIGPSFLLIQKTIAQDTKSQPFVLSQRVGLEIDSIEVEYFNLFPDLDGVKSVVYRKDNFDNLRMLLSLANGTDTTITFSKLATIELTKYIDNHESIADKPTLINWDLLPGYGLTKMNYFEDHGTTVFIHKTDHSIVAGKLLMISDSTVTIWASEQPFLPHNSPDKIQLVKVSDIAIIKRKQDLTGRIFGITLGVGLGMALAGSTFDLDNIDGLTTLYILGGGALVGGALGFLYDLSTMSFRKYKVNGDKSKYLNIKPKLDKRVMFTKIYPPELAN